MTTHETPPHPEPIIGTAFKTECGPVQICLPRKLTWRERHLLQLYLAWFIDTDHICDPNGGRDRALARYRTAADADDRPDDPMMLTVVRPATPEA